MRIPMTLKTTLNQIREHRLIEERDNLEAVIDSILDLVLGADRPEWSSAYGYANAVDDVSERMASM